jgi:uncharacterized phiE125 gp8 family phage protein
MQNYRLQLVTPAAAEPLVVSGDAKLDVTTHLRLDAPDGLETAYLNNLIKAARFWAENFTSRLFIEQTWDLLLPHGFPYSANYVLSSNEIRIPRAPLKTSGGIMSVKYLDTNGTQQTLTAGTDYVVAARGEMAVVLPAYGKSWPAVRAWIDASGNYPVEVRFIAGYGTDGTSVPEHFRQAMLLLIGHWYENREEVSEGQLATVPMAAEALLSQDRFSPW